MMKSFIAISLLLLCVVSEITCPLITGVVPDYGLKGFPDERPQKQVPCASGYYCVFGCEYKCMGRYWGISEGLGSEECDGPCRPGFMGDISSKQTNDTCSAICPKGFYCPNPGTLIGEEIPCPADDISVYCPGNNANPDPIPPGYVGLPFGSVSKYELKLCVKGNYCVGGVGYKCKAGYYGYELGQTTETCQGECYKGYYCPLGSNSPTKKICGGVGYYCPAATGAPIPVDSGYYSTPLNVSETLRESQSPCEEGYYCTGGIRYLCPEEQPLSAAMSSSIDDCKAPVYEKGDYYCYGQYYSRSGMEPCSLCYGYTTGSIEGNKKCTLCETGYYVLNNECVPEMYCDEFTDDYGTWPSTLAGYIASISCANNEYFGYNNRYCYRQLVDGNYIAVWGEVNKEQPTTCRSTVAPSGESLYDVQINFNNLAIYVFNDDIRIMVSKIILSLYQYLLSDLNNVRYDVEVSFRVGSNIMTYPELIDDVELKLVTLHDKLVKKDPVTFHHFFGITHLIHQYNYTDAFCTNNGFWDFTSVGFINYVNCPFEGYGGKFGKECIQTDFNVEWSLGTYNGCLNLNPPPSSIYIDYAYMVTNISHRWLNCEIMIHMYRLFLRRFNIPILSLFIHTPNTILDNTSHKIMSLSVRLEVHEEQKTRALFLIRDIMDSIYDAISEGTPIPYYAEISLPDDSIFITSHQYLRH
ncbi:hypothetical protein WA158_004639 [Blastocystis sp. Blastoise]